MSRPSWYRHTLPFALAIGLGAPLAAAAQGVAPHVPLATTLGDIAKLRSAYVEAFNAKDAKALNAMYMPDAVVIQAGGVETVGLPAIAKMNSDSASSWPHAVVSSSSVKVYGSIAVDVGTWTVHPKEGGEFVSRYLVVVRHGMHGWKLQNIAVVPVAK